MATTALASATGDSGASLEPYAQLLRALLPRANSLSVFNARGDLYWSSATSVSVDVTTFIAGVLKVGAPEPESAGLMGTVHGETIYLFWLRRDEAPAGEVPFGLVAIDYRQGSEKEPRSFAFVHGMVRPAIECLRREVLARNEIITLNGSLLEQDNDLEMLLSVSGGGADALTDGADDLKSIVASATNHLKVGLTALIVPEKGLILVQASTESPFDSGVLAKMHRHLLSITQMRREAVIINKLQIEEGEDAAAYRLLACPVCRPDGRPMGVLALFRPNAAPEFTAHHARLTELLARRVAAVIAHSYDSLTGLLTRPAFEQRVRGALERPKSTQSAWSALYIDMDRMHVINDGYGMHMGDRIISQMGELIRTRIPPGALAARISGDRFAILLPAALEDASTFAESLRRGAEDIGATFGDGKMQISISIGAAAVEPRSKEFAHAFATAETACKAANDRGRNRVEIFQVSDQSIVQRFTDINLVADVRRAIAENRLRLSAQLIAPLGNWRGTPHFEILLRMLSEDGQTMGPDHFMSAAQRYQLMPTIDRWVIGQAIEMLKPHAALLKHNPVVFTINFSGQSLRDENFTGQVVDLIKSSGLNPAAFCFELTESAAIGNLARAEGLMRQLRKVGCSIALDDFGTGLSSLAYLRSLPINMLKIDGSFVRDVLKDPRAESMVQAIAQLARSMSMVTVAEYVETEEIRTRVAALGVNYGQGFAIARPRPLIDILAELPLYAVAAEPSGIWAEDIALPIAHSA